MFLRPLVPAMIMLFGVAACSIAPVPRPAPAPVTLPGTAADAGISVAGQAVPTPQARAAARNFVAVVDALEPVAERECIHLNPMANCDFQIVVDDRPGVPANAFQTVDAQGRPIIAFTLSLIAEVRNADELAFVMAHESAHHIAGHLERQRENATLGAAVFGRVAGTLGGASEQDIRAAQEMGAMVGARTYSRDFELEADRLGTIIAARAGFNPLVGAEFFFRIPDPGDRFLGTHPSNAQRVEMVRRTAAELGFY